MRTDGTVDGVTFETRAGFLASKIVTVARSLRRIVHSVDRARRRAMLRLLTAGPPSRFLRHLCDHALNQLAIVLREVLVISKGNVRARRDVNGVRSAQQIVGTDLQRSREPAEIVKRRQARSRFKVRHSGLLVAVVA